MYEIAFNKLFDWALIDEDRTVTIQTVDESECEKLINQRIRGICPIQPEIKWTTKNKTTWF